MNRKLGKLANIPCFAWGAGFACCLASAALLTLSVLTAGLIAMFRPDTTAPPHNYIPIFDGHHPYGETVIPFTNRAGMIVVQASFGDQKIDAVFDTGSCELTWHNLDLPSRSFNRPTMGFDGYSNTVPAEWRKVARLKLGEFEVNDIYGLKLTTRQSMLTQAGDEPIQVILGNRVFAHTVLTIDYKKQVLIARGSEYDITQRSKASSDVLLDFTPSYVDRGVPLYMIVEARIGGFPVHAMFDTGHAASNLIIDQALRDRMSNLPYNQPYRDGNQWQWLCHVTEQTKPIPWAFGNVSGLSTALVLNGHAKKFGTDANIGYEVLRHFRITIDYDRHKLLLEPTDPSP